MHGLHGAQLIVLDEGRGTNFRKDQNYGTSTKRQRCQNNVMIRQYLVKPMCDLMFPPEAYVVRYRLTPQRSNARKFIILSLGWCRGSALPALTSKIYRPTKWRPFLTETANHAVILALSLTLTTLAVAALVRTLVHVGDLPRRRSASRRSHEARGRLLRWCGKGMTPPGSPTT